ncbi:MAG: hypothetical protein IT452_02975 [Planctomycetia bacterium]|nr:hypothetical protein [Planctomycetia bacterium]
MKTRMLVAGIALVVTGVVFGLAHAEETGKPMTEGRYRLFSGTNRQENLIFRIDTATGDTVVLNSTSHTWETVR